MGWIPDSLTGSAREHLEKNIDVVRGTYTPFSSLLLFLLPPHPLPSPTLTYYLPLIFTTNYLSNDAPYAGGAARPGPCLYLVSYVCICLGCGVGCIFVGVVVDNGGL